MGRISSVEYKYYIYILYNIYILILMLRCSTTHGVNQNASKYPHLECN